MPRRLVALLGLVSVVLLGAAGPASAAATYPATDNGVFVDSGSTSITVGDAVRMSAQTFEAGSDVTFVVSSPLASLGAGRLGAAAAVAACTTGSTCVTTADSSGVAAATITFTQPGRQTVTARGTGTDGKDLTLSSTVTVSAAGSAAPSGSNLARTGTNIIRFAVVGAALVAVGALILATVRRRRTAA